MSMLDHPKQSSAPVGANIVGTEENAQMESNDDTPEAHQECSIPEHSDSPMGLRGLGPSNGPNNN